MRRLLGSVLLGLAVGCGSGDSPTTPTLASIAGTWTLVSVNGSPVPFVFSQSATTKSEIVSNVVTIGTSGSYTSAFQVRTTINGQASVTTSTDIGTLSLQGSTVRVQSNSGAVYSGSIDGETLSIMQDSFMLGFKRQ